jgi:hypothetical protein
VWWVISAATRILQLKTLVPSCVREKQDWKFPSNQNYAHSHGHICDYQLYRSICLSNFRPFLRLGTDPSRDLPPFPRCTTAVHRLTPSLTVLFCFVRYFPVPSKSINVPLELAPILSLWFCGRQPGNQDALALFDLNPESQDPSFPSIVMHGRMQRASYHLPSLLAPPVAPKASAESLLWKLWAAWSLGMPKFGFVKCVFSIKTPGMTVASIMGFVPVYPVAWKAHSFTLDR